MVASLMLITGLWFVLNTSAQSQSSEPPFDPFVEMFVKIKGVEGGSRDVAHEGWIDVESFHYGVSRPGGGALRADGPREPANHHGLTITKGTDKATPFLYLHCSTGEPIEEVVLEVTHSTQEGHTVQEYRLRNVTVSSIRTAGGPKSRPRTAETVKLSYESIEWTYVKIDPATGRAASAAAAQWGLPANEGQQTKR